MKGPCDVAAVPEKEQQGENCGLCSTFQVVDLPSHKPVAAGDMVVVKAQGPRSRTAAGDTGTFSLGLVDETGPGDYRLCWCQGSRRPCTTAEDFNFDVGKLHIAAADYVWPLCTFQESVFRSWRDWQTFDDCCCNYDEAGAVGCKDEASYTYKLCAAYPLR
ncbi:unnamed protein product [Symbiodinium natans]|uniref:Uncharacterized protein n=1 Tax=Symbiodinium natans TaxID=878477 RepID=A0A812TGN5_9DINO|nr:unnamed protein product [Symbiodinium natans]